MKTKTLIIGLTGSIGMGKSTTLRFFREAGMQVFSADEAVHDLLGPKGAAVSAVARLFPEVQSAAGIDRKKLGQLVFSDPRQKRKLEKILHPLVEKAEKKQVAAAKKKKAPGLVLDIPLLFETGAEKRCDFVVCVTASAAIQKERVLKRPGMTSARLKAILAAQVPDLEKKHRSDFVIRTDKGIAAARRAVRQFLELILDY